MNQERLSNEQKKTAKNYKEFMVNRGIVSFKRASLTQCYEYSHTDNRFNNHGVSN